MKKIMFLVFVIHSFALLAQEEMETDRPDQTECSSVVLPGRVQVETGVVYEVKSGKNVKWSENTIYGPTTLVRIGILPSAEFRLEAGEYTSSERIETIKYHEEGFSPI